jgi:putative DNA primase/helicase
VDDANPFSKPAKPRRRKREPWEPPARALVKQPVIQEINGHDIHAADIIMPPGFTDDALGLRFTETFAPALRFVAAWNRWMIWDGKLWKKDDTLRVFDLVRRSMRVISAEAEDPKVRAILSSAKTVVGIEKLVRGDRQHAAMADQWDADPWLLNTPGGIVDLRTRELSPHNPTHLMTKSASVTPDGVPGGDCPRWRRFLERVTGNNAELEAYLKRVAGYWLTGLTREHAMWFFFGTGRNGKGVFLNTLVRIMGDYAMVASPDTFTESGSNKHLTVLARLQGARLVVAQETEEGVPWAEARIKSVTGGDPITANFMRQDPFTFTPQFKLGISGNHKPGLKSVDEAIRARFNLVPFTITIPPSERDPGLSEKLWEEAPGILSWMIEGCWDWQNNAKRLNPPGLVTAATSEYFDTEDATSVWIGECCRVDPQADAISSVLFKSWTDWAYRQGERPGSHKAFSRTMERHGYQKKREDDGVHVLGIELIPPPAAPSRTEPQGDRD